jgi:beta-glucanase (GH16 family)
MPAVTAARGVPADAAGYVDTVARYAAWYAALPEFGGTAAPSAPASPVAPAQAAAPPPSATKGSSTSGGDPAGGWRQGWSDEFDGPAGSAPDATRWSPDTGGDGWGNAELEFYTKSTSNAALDGKGHLVITARSDDAGGLSCWYGPCRYTSARLVTAGHFSPGYGRISARIRLPRGQGIWPSFWALGDNIGTVGWPQSGQIDLMTAHGDTPSTVESGLIGPNYNQWAASTLGSGNFADDYHTFTADWYPDHISFLVDGHVFSSQYKARAGAGWVFDHPFFLVLNVAVGGTQAGNPDAGTAFPQQMLVDWVRVYQPGPPTAPVTGRLTGLAGKCVEGTGTAVQLTDCTGSPGQSWTMGTDNTIRTGGRCLEVAGAGTANGTRVQLADCTGTGQAWQAQTNGQLVNSGSGRCLDVTDNKTASGTPLQIWDCWGASNQTWTLR